MKDRDHENWGRLGTESDQDPRDQGLAPTAASLHCSGGTKGLESQLDEPAEDSLSIGNTGWHRAGIVALAHATCSPPQCVARRKGKATVLGSVKVHTEQIGT